jgi:hypothetical protein
MMFGQNVDQNNLFSGNDTKIQPKKATPFFTPQKLHLSLDLGTSFIGGSKYYSGTFFNIAPNLNYLVSPRLKVEVGGVLTSGYNNFYQLPVSPESKSTNVVKQTNQALVYASGQYLLTDKLILTGSVYKTVNSDNSRQINPYYLDYKGMNMGIDYKITKNMSVGAHVKISNSNNNYLNYYNSNNSGLFSPYHDSFMGW